MAINQNSIVRSWVVAIIYLSLINLIQKTFFNYDHNFVSALSIGQVITTNEPTTTYSPQNWTVNLSNSSNDYLMNSQFDDEDDDDDNYDYNFDDNQNDTKSGNTFLFNNRRNDGIFVESNHSSQLSTSSNNYEHHEESINETNRSMKHYLKHLREQIKVLASDTYRNERIYYGIAYFIIVISSLFGNMLVCKICFRKRTKTNALIMSLAVSDLMMTMFNIPFNFFRIANYSWPFGSAMCFVVNFVQHLVVYISSYTMAIIAIQRYQSVSRFKVEKQPRNVSLVCLNNSTAADPSQCTTTTIAVNASANSAVDNDGDDDHHQTTHKQASNSSTSSINHNYNLNSILSFCLNVFSYPFRFLKKAANLLCCISGRNETTIRNNHHCEMFSMRTIYITIVITWLCSALISLLFTYSSQIVIKRDASYVLEVLVRELYNDNIYGGNENVDVAKNYSKLTTTAPTTTLLSSSNNSEQYNQSDIITKAAMELLATTLAAVASSSTGTPTTPITMIESLSNHSSLNNTENQSFNLINETYINVDDNNQDQNDITSNGSNEFDYLNNFLQEQTHSSNHIIRCRNPITENVRSYFDRTFSLKADFIKTITIFVTQYFIPLAIICYLYVQIGKIIYQQGKLCNVQGNAKAKIRQRKKLRRMLMLILMVAVFAVCWLPLHIFHILTDAGLINYNYQVFMMVHWLAMSSVSYNPFIYCWLNQSFRRAAMVIFCCGSNTNTKKNSITSAATNHLHHPAPSHQKQINNHQRSNINNNFNNHQNPNHDYEYIPTLLDNKDINNDVNNVQGDGGGGNITIEQDACDEYLPPTSSNNYNLFNRFIRRIFGSNKNDYRHRSASLLDDGEQSLNQHLEINGASVIRGSDPSMVSLGSLGNTSNFQLELESNPIETIEMNNILNDHNDNDDDDDQQPQNIILNIETATTVLQDS